MVADTGDDEAFADPPALSRALGVDLDDPEVARACATIGARLLGRPLTPTRIGRFVVIERLGAGGMGIVYAAFDPQLDRKVAIKLLFERGAALEMRERLVREAKAMARLAHPNVVQVFEVGEHSGQLFVAMEYVAGKTLREWCAAQPRSVRQILDACLQAGAGLAAAHAAGVVHGDFKPDNVLVGDDGRTRVADFGLARAADATALPDELATTLEVGETPGSATRGGTPGYAAPEQLRGAPADTSTEQFSFCVTVWESLVGALPFAAMDPGTMCAAVAQRRIVPAPRAKLPAWVEAVLRRGLSERNAAGDGRFATFDELLRALARDPSRSLRRGLGGAVLLGVITAAFVGGAALRSSAREDPCSGGDVAMAEAWPSEARLAAIERIATGSDYGAAMAPRVEAAAATYREQWLSGYREACTAHLRGEQSANAFDQQMSCLQRGRGTLAQLGELLEDVDANELARLVLAFQSLPSPERCGEARARSAHASPPPPEAEPLVVRLGQAIALHGAGDYDAAIAATDDVAAEARANGYRGLLAHALYIRGITTLASGSAGDAVEVLHEALGEALAAGADDIAVQAWSQGAWAEHVLTADSKELFDGEAVMIALAERQGDPRVLVGLYHNLGSIEISRGHRELARANFRRAIANGERAVDASIAVASAEQGLALVVDDAAERDRLMARGAATWIGLVGREHPRALSARVFQAGAIDDPRAALRLLEPTCDDYRNIHPELRAYVADCDATVARYAELLGDDSKALSASERSLAAMTEPLERGLAEASVAWLHGDAQRAAELAEPWVAARLAERAATPQFYDEERLGRGELVLAKAWTRIGRAGADEMLARALEHLGHAAELQPSASTNGYLELARRFERERG